MELQCQESVFWLGQSNPAFKMSVFPYSVQISWSRQGRTVSGMIYFFLQCMTPDPQHHIKLSLVAHRHQKFEDTEVL